MTSNNDTTIHRLLDELLAPFPVTVDLQDFKEELRGNLLARVAELEADGMDAPSAARTAVHELGDITDAVGALAALALGRSHHLLNHGAGQAFTRQRGDVARVHADMQAVDMGIPDARHHQGGGKRGFSGRGAGQRQQQATIGHGASPKTALETSA